MHRIHTSGDTILIPIGFKNGSVLSFEVDFLRLYTKDSRPVKRSVRQEVEILPLYTHNLPLRGIPTGGKQTTVLALPKLTLTDGRKLVVEIFEKAGTRHVTLEVTHRAIENARPLW